jgi:hypothetical protein
LALLIGRNPPYDAEVAQLIAGLEARPGLSEDSD